MNIALIGYGKWGKVLFSNLKTISKNIFLIKKKSKLKFTKGLDWIFISTQDKYHYKIAKFYLNKKVNVFCEKPITRNLQQTKSLFDIAKKNKIQLIENQYYSFFETKIKLQKNKVNYIYRQKRRENTSMRDVLYVLTYHDLLLLYDKVSNANKNIIKFEKFLNNELVFTIDFTSKLKIQFQYNLNKLKKKHIINKISISSKKNILLKYVKDVLDGKINTLENKKKSLFIIKILNKIENNLEKL
jgi:hypothetical protein